MLKTNFWKLHNVRSVGVLLCLLIWGIAPVFSFAESSNANNSVVPESQQAVVQAKDFANEQKQELEDHLRKELEELDGQIEQLRSQTQEIQEKAKDKIQEKLEALKEQKKSILPRIENLRDSSEQAWKEMKEGIVKAVDNLKESVDRASKAF